MILDHQNPLVHIAPLYRSTRTGSLNQKVEPFPRLDSTQMRPPCISAMRLDPPKDRSGGVFLDRLSRGHVGTALAVARSTLLEESRQNTNAPTGHPHDHWGRQGAGREPEPRLPSAFSVWSLRL
jgi:hypothetical protein